MSSKAQRRYLEMVRCRAYGHAWEDRGWLPMIWRSLRVWDQLLTCPRCTSTRLDRRSWGTLTIVHREYDQPEDYPGSVSRAEALRILVEHDAKENAA